MNIRGNEGVGGVERGGLLGGGGRGGGGGAEFRLEGGSEGRGC
jgi:hypothetical protein